MPNDQVKVEFNTPHNTHLKRPDSRDKPYMPHTTDIVDDLDTFHFPSLSHNPMYMTETRTGEHMDREPPRQNSGTDIGHQVSAAAASSRLNPRAPPFDLPQQTMNAQADTLHRMTTAFIQGMDRPRPEYIYFHGDPVS